MSDYSEYMQQIDKLQKELEQYRAVLHFYADPKNWLSHSGEPVKNRITLMDLESTWMNGQKITFGGATAREALKGDK